MFKYYLLKAEIYIAAGIFTVIVGILSPDRDAIYVGGAIILFGIILWYLVREGWFD